MDKVRIPGWRGFLLINIDYEELRQEHVAIIEPIFDSMMHLFPSWVDTVSVFYDEDTLGGASCAPYKPYKRVTINVSKELLASETTKLEGYIAHEIAHCYNEGLLRVIFEYLPLLSIEDETRKLFHKACIDAIEFQTEDLAVLFCRGE